LRPSGLDNSRLDQVFGEVLTHSVDFADLYFQLSHEEAWSLEDGIVKDGSASIEQGVGVRALSGEKTGFAYSDEIVLPALEEASRAARAIAVQGGGKQVRAWEPKLGHSLYLPGDPSVGLTDQQKVEWLERVDRETRKLDPRIVHVTASVTAVHEVVLIATSDGELAADVRPLVRFNVSVLVEQNGRREQGYCGMGGRFSLADLVAGDKPLALGREAVRQALVNLEAKPAPAGAMTVVLGPGWPGILLHEAIGHGLEGDFNRKGASAFTGRVGQRVGARGVTVLDDGTIPDRRGSLNVDDEGNATQKNVLIEDGILKGYIQDSMNARLMGTATTGNGRRESYAAVPMPRMTNTYMLPGESAPEDILRSVKKGLYCVAYGGGQVNISNGDFVFSVTESYMIEDGKVTAPVRGVTLIGNGPETLSKVTMVGSDLQLSDGRWTCGKEGQSVPVGVGMPTVLVSGITVGGTKQ
jgi:TldD protein